MDVAVFNTIKDALLLVATFLAKVLPFPAQNIYYVILAVLLFYVLTIIFEFIPIKNKLIIKLVALAILFTWLK
jgi:hypothetical protein